MAEQKGLMSRLKGLVENGTRADGPKYRRVRVLINPASGSDEPILGSLNEAFHDSGIDWQIAVTKRAGDAERYAQEAVAAGVDVVAVYGGDGTVLEAACGLTGSTVPLAILPGGTANVLSVELNIPRALADAAALLGDPTARLRPVDMGKVGEYPFFHLGLGFEGEMIESADRVAKDRSGMWAYILSAARKLRTPPKARYRLVLDGKEVEIDGINCMITNFGSVGLGRLKLAHTIDMSDGLLDVMVIQDVSISTLLSAAADAVIEGELAGVDALWHRQAREVTVEADPPQRATRDGEVLELSEITAHVVPGAVSVLVPGPAEE